MNVIKQGENECMLATISALSRVPLKRVRQIAVEFAGCSWDDLIVNHPLYWRTVKHILKEVGLLKQKIPTGNIEFAKGNKRRTLPKGKEGSICTQAENDFLAHIDPFSDELIWGTYNEEPMSIEEYKLELKAKGSTIIGIWY